MTRRQRCQILLVSIYVHHGILSDEDSVGPRPNGGLTSVSPAVSVNGNSCTVNDFGIIAAEEQDDSSNLFRLWPF